MHYKSHQSGIESNSSFTIKVEDLIREIVIQNDIPYYRIESGVEHHTEESEDNYVPVIRIITYFEDTVNKISHILHDEFDVDIERSVDKKKIRIETFAYKNINYTARLKADRQQQTEYRRSGNKKFEIQICSMLQDAWSGIEKELGYDNIVVPDEAKRDFYRVGALLEMADIEFLKIRTELAQKKNDKTATIAPEPQPAKVAEAPKTMPVDTNANTFVEHLQAVAKEVRKELPVIQPEQAAAFVPPVAPVQEFSKVVPPAPVAAPEPVVAHVPPVPPPSVPEAPKVVAPAPVPEPVVAYVPPAPPTMLELPVINEAPKPEPKVVEFTPPPPVVAAPVAPAPSVAAQAPVQKAASPIPAVAPIAPQRSAPSPHTGIAPRPAVVPAAEPSTNGIAAGINIDTLKELAQSINNTEHKNGTTPVEVPQQVVDEVRKAVVVPTPPPVVAEIPKPIAEVVIPAVAPVSDLNVNESGQIHVPEQPVVQAVNEQATVARTIQLDDNVQMTDLTLREFVAGSKLLKEIDQQIAERAGAKINSDIDIEGDVERLRFLKVYTLKQLQDRLTDNKNDIVAFAEKWIGKDNGGSFDSGISLFYLEYLLVGKKNDPAFAVEYVVKFISDNDYSARYIIPTYNSIHNTEAPNFSHLTLKA